MDVTQLRIDAYLHKSIAKPAFIMAHPIKMRLLCGWTVAYA
jgi:hypothetical protein